MHEIYRDWHDRARRVRGRPRALRRGLGRAARRRWPAGCGPTRCSRRSTSRTSRRRGRRPALRARHRRVARGVRAGRRPEHLGALEPRRRPARLPPRAHRREPAGPRHRAEHAPASRTRATRPAPRARRDGAHARAARQRLPLPGRGARPSRGHRPARRRPAGPDLVPHERRALRPRRLPRADPVGGRRPRVRLQHDRRHLAAAAGRLGRLLARRPGGHPRVDARALPHARCACVASTAWASDRSRGSRALRRASSRSRNGTVTVVANTGADDVPVPSSLAKSSVLVASGPFDGTTIHGDTTVWFTTP